MDFARTWSTWVCGIKATGRSDWRNTQVSAGFHAGLLSMKKFLLRKPAKRRHFAKGLGLTFRWDLNLLCARP